jgi:hypothetical protein
MAPLLVSALLGVGVKLATDFLMAGAKDLFKSSGASTSFASTLDKVRKPEGAVPTAGTRPLGLDAGLADRSRLVAVNFGGGLASPGPAQGAEAYQRLAEIAPQAI